MSKNKSLNVSMRRVGLPLVLGMIIWAPSTHAALVFGVGVGPDVGIGSLAIQPGESVDVDIYITQTGTTSILDSEATSINAAGVVIAVNGSGSGSLAMTNLEFAPLFQDDLALSDLGASQSLLSVGTTKPASAALGGEIPGVLASEDGVDDDSLRLGTIRLSASGGASGDFTLTLEGETFLGAFVTTTPQTPFDGVEVGTVSIPVSITAIPEPSSIALICAVGFAVALRRRQSQKHGLPPSLAPNVSGRR